MKIVALIYALIFITGCALSPISESKKKNLNDVAAVSVFNDNLYIAHIGTTVFNNTIAGANVAAWALNEKVSVEVEASLKVMSKTFTKVEFDKKRIADTIAAGDTATNRLLNKQNAALNDYLLSTAKAAGARYLFIFRPIRSDNFPYSYGFGLYCRSAFGMKGKWQAYTLFHVALWDLANNEIMFQGAITPPDVYQNTDKDCEDIKPLGPDKFAAQFHDTFQKLAHDMVSAAMKKAGLL